MTINHQVTFIEIAIVAIFFLTGVAAIVIPWIGLRRTGRDIFRTLGILSSFICGWNCAWIVAALFIAVMPSFFFFANPIMFVVVTVVWCTSPKRSDHKGEALSK